MPSLASLAVVSALALSAAAAPTLSRPAPNKGSARKSVEVQAHRGGLGLRSEESLWAFAYALEIGVNVLEMDTLFTSDGVPVIWHDHYIYDTKCTGDYVGQYIANLTLAQVKTLNCTLQLDNHPQQELHPTTRIATLEEVLDLVDCYGDKDVTINLETKLSPIEKQRNQTFGYEKYVNEIMPIFEKRSNNWINRVTIQSFDWRTLVGIHAKWPKVPIVALMDHTTIVPDSNGDYVWLNYINLEKDFKGDWIKAAKSIGSSVISPVHGYPSSKSINTPGYTEFTTKDVVKRAHKLGMTVVPWTIEDEVTAARMLVNGVDGIISNYPERVFVEADKQGFHYGKTPNKPQPKCFVQASP